MPYAYINEGSLATCNKLTSIPEGVDYVEFERGSLPADPSVLNIVDGEVVIDPAKAQDEAKRQAKINRDDALNTLTHDLGGGRVIQVRRQDEQNIRNAIELMGRHELPAQDWLMADNTTHSVSVAELQAALKAGQDKAADIWAAFFASES